MMNEQIEKYFQGELSLDERCELLKKVESDKALQAEFTKRQHIQALLSFSDRMIDKEDTQRHYLSFIHTVKRRNIRRVILQTIRYAAAIASLVVIVHLFHVHVYTPGVLAATETSLFVPASQRISLTLQDGTLVWLNAQTRLTYPTVFPGNERRVKIEGEAYFEVAKDHNRPFIVISQGIEMEVLGTTFNVYSYPAEEERRISLIEGSLQVGLSGSESEKTILKSNEQVTIRGNHMAITPIQYADYFLWKDGIYSFNNEVLSNILKRLELYYDIHIEVKDPSILQWKYTGKFRQRDGIDEILRLMQRIRAFTVTKDDKNNRITLSK
jgi:ferric-dicitrate binding protein FerR (iron transport regulator)